LVSSSTTTVSSPIDPEGIAASVSGGAWLAHEGSELFLNILGKVDEDGVVPQIITLPGAILWLLSSSVHGLVINIP
jgi:hypothetical protein